jgi:hypothetical protein
MPGSVSADDLAAARERRRQAEAAVEAYGDDVQTIADAHQDALDLLASYEDTATGSGNFKAYVEFEEKFVTLVEELPDDLPTRSAFEEANELLDRRRLSESHFEQARELLAPAREVVETLEEREAARRHLRETRQAVRRRLSTLDDEIAARERLQELGAVDLDAPTERLRDPIEAYNDAVTGAFEAFRREQPARALLSFVDATTAYPLVDFAAPPEGLREYLTTSPVGAEPLPTVLDYVGYSRSKLSHYVDDPDEFRHRVATHETYLSRLDVSPLLAAWPPLPANELRPRAEELVAVTARFADESVVASARAVRDLTYRDDYEELRRVAVARDELTDAERDRLASGAVADELARLRDERDRLQSALDDVDEA